MEHAIARGILSPAQVATLIGVTPPTVRKMISRGHFRHVLRPPSREVIMNAVDIITDLRRIKGFEYSPLHPMLITAACFYVANQLAAGKPVDFKVLPKEVAEELAKRAAAAKATTAPPPDLSTGNSTSPSVQEVPSHA
jgi:hypothetical protein